MKLKIEPIPALNDNYIYWLWEPLDNVYGVVDPGDHEPIIEILHKKQVPLNAIFVTHHHGDHIGGIPGLMDYWQRYQAKLFPPPLIYAASGSVFSQWPNYRAAHKNQTITFGKISLNVDELPGHTLDHLGFSFKETGDYFCGDVLFQMGCGALFGGTLEQMWESLDSIRRLPRQTKIWCAHEYAEICATFAVDVEPQNIKLQERVKKVEFLRAQNSPTVPMILEEELATNPYLRPESPEIRKNFHLPLTASNLEVFTALRTSRNR